MTNVNHLALIVTVLRAALQSKVTATLAQLLPTDLSVHFSLRCHWGNKY